VFPNVGLQENIKGLFIDKIKCAVRAGVRSIAGGALNPSPTCVRQYVVRLISGSHVHSIVCCAFNRTAFDREMCDRSQIIALKSHDTSVETMEARAG
jgi:hypothetical protein